MDSRTWLARLELSGIKLGLDTISRLCAALGHPERRAPVLHVAGTNGKGSVAAVVSHALLTAGYRVGRYTSPHLIHLEERFVVDDRAVQPRELDAALGQIREAAGTLQAAGELAVEPTYFEVTTAAAFLVFAARGVDLSVVEVGLGGRFDATNVVLPLCTAITSIAMDHQAQLGDSIEAIAAEKAGIAKRGVPMVVGRVPPEALETVTASCVRAGAPVVDAASDVSVTAASMRGRYEVTLRTPRGTYGPVLLALAGRHQVDNAVVATRLLEIACDRGLAVPRSAIERGLAEARWAGRLQSIVVGGRTALVDGAHNPAGTAALASYLRESADTAVPLVFGAMHDKDLAAMLAPLAGVARPLILTRAPGTRAASPGALRDAASAAFAPDDVEIEPDIGRALERAWHRAPAIVVAGSLYLAGDVLARLGTPVS